MGIGLIGLASTVSGVEILHCAPLKCASGTC
jgi:hypothetical protein